MHAESSCKVAVFAAGGIMDVAKLNHKMVSSDRMRAAAMTLNFFSAHSNDLYHHLFQGHSFMYLLEPELLVELKPNLQLLRFIAGVDVLMLS